MSNSITWGGKFGIYAVAFIYMSSLPDADRTKLGNTNSKIKIKNKLKIIIEM